MDTMPLNMSLLEGVNMSMNDLYDMSPIWMVFPPPLSTFEIALCCIHAAVFIFGMIGNLYVMNIIVRILIFARNSLTSKHLFIFLLGLNIVDLMVLSFLPLVIADMANGSWMFGSLMCKIFLSNEVFCKLMSVMILAALSADRYVSVCRPASRFRFRSTKGATVTVLVLALLGICLLPLVPIYGSTVTIPVTAPSVSSAPGTSVNFSLTECTFGAPLIVAKGFLYTLFIVGFCIPGALIGCFYALMLRRLLHQRRQFKSVPVWKITRSVLLVIGFYYLCWSPYWLLSITGSLLDGNESETWFVVISVVIHCLPYVNSAVNPFLYCYLNKEIRRNLAAVRALSTRRSASTNPPLLKRLSLASFMSRNRTPRSSVKGSPSPQLLPATDFLLTAVAHKISNPQILANRSLRHAAFYENRCRYLRKQSSAPPMIFCETNEVWL